MTIRYHPNTKSLEASPISLPKEIDDIPVDTEVFLVNASQ